MATALTDLRKPPAEAPAGIDPLVVRVAHWMDDFIQIPGTSRRIGLDGLLGLIPGLGDLVSSLTVFLMLNEAKRLGVSRFGRWRIAGYFLIDFLLGSIPLVGDLFDFGYKANLRSLRLLERHLRKRKRG